MNEKVISDFIAGDKKAFEQVYCYYSDRIYKRLLYILKDSDDAQEVLHNIFLKIWINRAAIDVNKNFLHYLTRIADSSAVDLLRRNIRSQLAYDKYASTTNMLHESVEDTFAQKEEREILENAIAQLPPQRKLVFTLCKIEGKSYAEVSEILGLSTATISNHLTLAMKQIRLFATQHQKEFGVFFLLSLIERF